MADLSRRAYASYPVALRRSLGEAQGQVVGLETELGLFLDLLVHKRRKIDIMRLIEMYTVEPRRLLKINAGTLSIGAAADVTLIGPDLEWTVRVDTFESASRNSPFDGWKLKGRAVRTIVGGKTVWKL